MLYFIYYIRRPLVGHQAAKITLQVASFNPCNLGDLASFHSCNHATVCNIAILLSCNSNLCILSQQYCNFLPSYPRQVTDLPPPDLVHSAPGLLPGRSWIL